MSTIDVVARLQLRAEQFSSETGARFAEMKARAASTANEVRSSFSSSFAEVQKLAATALQLPRTTSGSLDLSSEIASLRAAATASDQTAAAQRELSTAFLAASNSGRAVTEEMRREADAAMVAARAAEADAGATRQRILALEAVQTELNRTASATGMLNRAANDNVQRSGQQRQSMIMLGQQLQDFSVQVSSGQSVATAFTQQIGQATFAVQGMGGKLASVAAFLGTGWGIAATIAATAIGPLVTKLIEGNVELDKAVEKLKADARQSEISAQAKERFTLTVEGVSQAIRDQGAAQRKAIEAEHSGVEQDLKNAESNRQHEISIRRVTLALLERVKAEAAAANATNFGAAGGAGAGMAQSIYAGRVAEVEKMAAAARADLVSAQAKVNEARVQVAAEAGRLEVDKSASLKKSYDDQVTAAKDAARATGDYGKLQRDVAKIERDRTAAMKALAEQTRATGTANRQFGREIDVSEATRIVQGIGGRVTSGLRSTERQSQLYADMLAGRHNGPVAAPGTSAHERGNAVDVAYGPGITIASIKAAFAEEGVRVTKALAEPGQRVFHIEFASSAEKVAKAIERETTAQEKIASSIAKINQGARNVQVGVDPRKIDKSYDDSFVRTFGDVDPMAGMRGGIDEFDRQQREMAEARDQSMRQSQALAERQFQELSDTFYGLFSGRTDDLWRRFKEQGFNALADLAAQEAQKLIAGVFDPRSAAGGADPSGAVDSLEKAGRDLSRAGVEMPRSLKIGFKDVLAGAGTGLFAGGAFAAITGGKSSPVGSAIGGALGETAGKALGPIIGKTIGGTLGKTLGSAAGPLGSVVGGILGNVVGGLFQKTKYASAAVNFGNGQLSGGTATGNSGAARAASSAAASSIAKGLNAIADQLGATITGTPNITIGTYKDNYRVSTTGYNGKLNFKGTSAVGLNDFGQDEQAAIQFAIKQAVGGSVIKGISQASINIIKSGQDLEASITKAGLIEAIPRDLKAMLDPVGAAIDEVNRKWQKTVDALKEGGATAEQMAEAQRLYDMQLAQVKTSTASASQGLKDFLAGLKVGSGSPFSLRDQEATARSALQPYLDQISGGQSIDQSKYQDAAKTFLDIERQLYGSTQRYFDSFDAIQSATTKAISAIDNATPITKAVESPFAKATADAAAKTAAAVQTGNEMTGDTNDLLQQLVAQNAELLGRLGGGGASSAFIGSKRLFGVAAA